MIGRLEGEVLSEELTGTLVVDVAGVGYELACPIGTRGRASAGRSPGHLVFYVHTHVREDQLDLFGFATPEDRACFRALITVPNVGPRTALAVLHALSPEELAQAIETDDKTSLGRVPGIGKKTAERLVLELKGKLPQFNSSRPSKTAAPQAPPAERLVLALTGLGYKANEAEKALASLGDELEGLEMSAQLRLALAHLSRGPSRV